AAAVAPVCPTHLLGSFTPLSVEEVPIYIPRLRKRPFSGFLGILALVGCRQDLHDQPRLKALAESDFYADLRSARNPVDGTVARGQLHEDAYFHTGKVGANPGNYMPSEVPVK